MYLLRLPNIQDKLACLGKMAFALLHSWELCDQDPVPATHQCGVVGPLLPISDLLRQLLFLSSDVEFHETYLAGDASTVTKPTDPTARFGGQFVIIFGQPIPAFSFSQ